MKKRFNTILLMLGTGGLIFSLMSFRGRVISQNIFDLDSPKFYGGYYYPLEYKIIATISILLLVAGLLLRKSNKE